MRTLRARLPRLVRALAVGLLGLPLAATTAHPQYFGRNKVQYDRFQFRILPVDHFDLFFYPSESLATADAARMSERWYQRHSALLGFTFNKNPLILYADPPDFQQSNVIEGMIDQGTGGVTEGAKDRVIMPFTGAYAETDHVLGHELVHVFQYRIAESMKGGLANIERIPLWLIEGMAEYLSLGRDDPNTAMWLRDALRRNDLPSIKRLTTDPRYFPYRYGQALWAFIGGVWGDEAVNRLFRAALQGGWESGIQRALGISGDSLSRAWHSAIRQEYGRALVGRSAPNEVGRPVVVAARHGDQNVSPAISPDGRHMAFFSSRSLFGMELFVAEVATGRVVKQLTSVTANPHFDALSFISSGGSWSPDGTRLAFVVYTEGDNELDIMDVNSGTIERRIQVSGVGAMSDPAWSPDGLRIAFSGIKGGISDLYLHDLSARTTEQLTRDREAQIHPAWSPDGRTLAFVTDAGPETSFTRLSFGRMRLALMDMTTRDVTLVPRLGSGKAVNPQFSPDGRVLYFIADQDGVSDIYRLVLATGDVLRVTRIATGVSGITALSPTLSVARQTGQLLFSVFDRQGYSIRTLSAPQALGTVVTAVGLDESFGLLPPASALTTSIVSRALRNPDAGLPPPYRVASRPYRSGLSLDYIGGPSIGVGFGGGFGTGLAGGVALAFSDMLGNQIVQTVVQAQGEVKDLGGEILYLNRSRRWNWGAQAYHIPLVGAFATFQNVGPGAVYTQVVQRVFFDDAELVTQYPFSTTRRFELSAGVQRISFDTQVDSFFVIGDVLVDQNRSDVPSGTGLTFGTASAALVGDNSFFGFTSPIAGGRYRFEASPNIGSLNFQTLLADYRKYIFLRPFTLAFRGIHYGRYGSDAEHNRMQPLYVGQPTLIRGYDIGSFDISECTSSPSGQDDCTEFSRLNGSRIAAANLEVRIPLIGTDRLGLLKIPFLPTEIAPFIDVGAAWNKGEPESWRFDRNTTDRVPVFSTGVSARFNLLGFAVVEAYWVRPYQRPGRSPYFGFQLAPGW